MKRVPCRARGHLADEGLEGALEVVPCALRLTPRGAPQARLHVVGEDKPGGGIEGGANRSDLAQQLRAVAIGVNHPADGFEMARSTCKAPLHIGPPGVRVCIGDRCGVVVGGGSVSHRGASVATPPDGIRWRVALGGVRSAGSEAVARRTPFTPDAPSRTPEAPFTPKAPSPFIPPPLRRERGDVDRLAGERVSIRWKKRKRRRDSVSMCRRPSAVCMIDGYGFADGHQRNRHANRS